jgi:hypothetical protein
MLGSLLGAHSDCIVTPESQFKLPCLQVLSGSTAATARTRAVDVVRNHPRFKIWDLEIDPGEALLHAESPKTLVSWLVEEYARSRGKPEASVWIDHTGTNLRYAARLLEQFPDARFIHLVRDGRGVAASVIPLDWGPNTVQRAAHWWTEKICFGLAVEGYLQDRALPVCFEDIVISPESSLRGLCDFLEIPYESAMLEGSGFDVPAFTRTQHQLVGEAPDPSRATAWKSQLSSREIEIFEVLTGDLLVALGYELESSASAAPVRWRERLHAYGVEGIRGLVVNRIRHRTRLQRSIAQSNCQKPVESQLVVSDSHVAF